MIHHTPKSSAISSLSFDPSTNEMEVTFHTGTTARHSCERETFDKICNAESAGKAYSEFKRKPKKVEMTNKFK